MYNEEVYTDLENFYNGGDEGIKDESLYGIDYQEPEEIVGDDENTNNALEPGKTFVGVVVDCNLLNVREKPDFNSDVIERIGLSTELKIDMDNSTEDWFSVSTKNGISGYCMKKFIAVKQ